LPRSIFSRKPEFLDDDTGEVNQVPWQKEFAFTLTLVNQKQPTVPQRIERQLELFQQKQQQKDGACSCESFGSGDVTVSSSTQTFNN